MRRALRWLPLAIIVGLGALVVATGWYRHLSLETLLAHESGLRAFVADHRIAAIAAYAGLYVVTVALSLPGGLLLTLAGGFLFGWLLGGIATVIAATVGATLVFLVARTSLGTALAERAGPRLAALRRGFHDDAFSYMLFLRLVPLFPFWLVNIAPALIGVPLAAYVGATVIGIIPGTFAFAFAGSGLDSVLGAQREAFEQCAAAAQAAGRKAGEACSLSFDPGSLLTPKLAAALVVLGILALLPVAAKKVMGRRARGRAG